MFPENLFIKTLQMTDFSIFPMYAVAIALLTGYLIGSVPYGLVLTKIFLNQDVRKIGSGNIGATNVLRTGNKPLAALTLFLDVFKGAIAYWIGVIGWSDVMGLYLALAALLGHCYPVWLKFSGGKGVATFVGIVFSIHWVYGLIFAALWLTTALITRYSSLSALVATSGVLIVSLALTGGLLPLSFGGTVMALVSQTPVVVFFALAALLIIWKHRGNIKRLIAGQEPKIGKKHG
jgi:glycerol-3-phosphate acyltransferase PlsY